MPTTVCHERNLALAEFLSCTKDEGRPLGVALQEETSNRLKLHWSRANVVSVEGKGSARLSQVRDLETNENEPPMKCRKRREGVKTGG